VAKSKLVQFLVVGIVVLVLLSSGEVFAEQHDDTSAADDWFAYEVIRKAMESYNEDGSSDPWQTVAEQGVVEGSGQLPFEEYNSPPDISGGQQVEQNKKQISHPICPGAVGNLIQPTECNILNAGTLRPAMWQGTIRPIFWHHLPSPGLKITV
jgi:hypothetical protein